MSQEHLVFLRSFRQQCWSLGGEDTLVGHGKDADIKLRIDQPPWFGASNVNTQLLKEPQNRTDLHRAGRVMVPGNEHDRCGWQCITEPLELSEGKNNSVVRGPNGVEEISSHHHRVRSGGNDAVNGGAEGAGDIGLPLVDTSRGLPVVLPDAQVGVRDMGKFHGWRMGVKVVKSKHLRAGGKRVRGWAGRKVKTGPPLPAVRIASALEG